MSAGKVITKEVMQQVWHLHNLGQTTNQIIYLLDISAASVSRIISIMKAVETDDTVYLETKYNDCEYIKCYARELLGKTEQIKEEEQPKAELNEAQAMVNLLERVDKMADLLEKLCKALGVEGV